jgi:opacity protein-like surface antigen
MPQRAPADSSFSDRNGGLTMKLRIPLLAAVLLAFAASAHAQYRGGTVEIEGFGGYLFGGGLGHFHDFNTNVNAHNSSNGNCCDDNDTHLTVDDDAYYGGRVGYNFTPFWEVETEFAQSKTHLEIESHHDIPNVRVGDLRFDYFMAYLTMNFAGMSRWVPYFTIGNGAADLHRNIPGVVDDSVLRYTFSAGGGVKYFVTPHFAFRFDTRSYSTHLSDEDICGQNFCSNHSWVTNFVVNGGLIIAF